MLKKQKNKKKNQKTWSPSSMKQPPAITQRAFKEHIILKLHSSLISCQHPGCLAWLYWPGPLEAGHFENKKDKFYEAGLQSPNLSIWPISPCRNLGFESDFHTLWWCSLSITPGIEIILVNNSFQPVPNRYHLLDIYSSLLLTINWPAEYLEPITDTLLRKPSVPLFWIWDAKAFSSF